MFIHSVFFAKHGHKGTLQLENADEEVEVISTAQIFLFKSGDSCLTFLKGLQYATVGFHSYSDNAIVEAARNNITFEVKQVKRRVMLYQRKIILINHQ